MILFIDSEPASGRKEAVRDRIDAARTRLTYRLEDLLDHPVHLARYSHLTAELFNQIEVEAAFISGNTVAPSEYGAEADLLFGLLRDAPFPIFGFCGGHQLIALAHGIAPTPITMDGEPVVERGYLPVNPVENHSLLEAMGSDPIVRHYHSWEVPVLPPGFTNLASTDMCEIQMMVDERSKVVGTQFHPEYWTEDHPAGRSLITEFLSWAGVAVNGPTVDV